MCDRSPLFFIFPNNFLWNTHLLSPTIMRGPHAGFPRKQKFFSRIWRTVVWIMRPSVVHRKYFQFTSFLWFLLFLLFNYQLRLNMAVIKWGSMRINNWDKIAIARNEQRLNWCIVFAHAQLHTFAIDFDCVQIATHSSKKFSRTNDRLFARGQVTWIQKCSSTILWFFSQLWLRLW